MTNYPDPTPEMLDDPLFEAIWQAIKGWDIERTPGAGYAGATGNDARHILDRLASLIPAGGLAEEARDSARLDFIEREWFGKPDAKTVSFRFNECWDVPGATLRDAISAAMAASTPQGKETP